MCKEVGKYPINYFSGRTTAFYIILVMCMGVFLGYLIRMLIERREGDDKIKWKN